MSDQTLTLDDLAGALRALRLLAMDFGHLPAPDVQVSPLYPDRLSLTFHHGLDDFEVWRQALKIRPEGVIYREQSTGRTRVLNTFTTFAGAVLELTGFSDVDTLTPAAAGGAP
ncbi:hypothetical protein D9753_19465 [Streptomyces dangxiongensis]|uniref:Uncharacterized protein n=1 Tax=Streptomyces dangxiongensis TaxID=1442032 RepID=A0A3G2JH66_9ACTN|nr:hypothetical protein [Streptomyces dangxiongensis]AYN40705.1 hypothetical protein D9753_19465 [Streptomyces dangxiongensis]